MNQQKKIFWMLPLVLLIAALVLGFVLPLLFPPQPIAPNTFSMTWENITEEGYIAALALKESTPLEEAKKKNSLAKPTQADAKVKYQMLVVDQAGSFDAQVRAILYVKKQEVLENGVKKEKFLNVLPFSSRIVDNAKGAWTEETFTAELNATNELENSFLLSLKGKLLGAKVEKMPFSYTVKFWFIFSFTVGEKLSAMVEEDFSLEREIKSTP